MTLNPNDLDPHESNLALAPENLPPFRYPQGSFRKSLGRLLKTSSRLLLLVILDDKARNEAVDERTEILNEVEQRHGAQVARRLARQVEQRGPENGHANAKVPKDQAVDERQRYLVLGGGKILGQKLLERPNSIAEAHTSRCLLFLLHVADADGGRGTGGVLVEVLILVAFSVVQIKTHFSRFLPSLPHSKTKLNKITLFF